MVEAKAKPLKKEEEGADDLPLSSRSRAKSVKKEDLEVEDDVPLALSKSRFNKSKSPPAKFKKEDEDDKDQKMKREEGKSKVKPVSKVKRSPADESDDEFLKDKKKTTKTTIKKEVKLAGKKGNGSVANGKVKAKKVYDLPGQKHDPPEEREPLRIFYETLYDQVPGSEMAAFWMMEWGLLPLAEAREVYEKKLKKANEQKLRSPVKAVVSVKQTSTVMAKKVLKTDTSISKKRMFSESDDDDDDFIASRKTRKQKASSKSGR